MIYCENQKNTIDNDKINNDNNKSSLSDGTDILTVPRAEYLLWCKRRMENDNSNNSCPVVDNNNNNNSMAIPKINTMLQIATTPSITSSLDKKKTTTVTVPKGSPFGFALPPELLLEILSYLKESQSALYAVSLVCRQWMFCAAPLLYRHAKIMDTFRYATFILTLTRNKKALCYGSLIHTLDLAAGNKLFGNSNNNKQANTTTTSNTITGITDQQIEEERDNTLLFPTPVEDDEQDPRREVITRPEYFIDNHGNIDVNDQSTTSTTTTVMGARATGADWTIQRVNPNNNDNNAPITMTTVTTTNNNNNNDIEWEALLQQRQQQEENNNNNNNNNSNNTTIESEYFEARDMKHGHLFVTTSSLLQVAKTCKNLTCLNMSLTTLFYDSMIAETGEYVSTLQHYAVQPGLTHILIPMSKVIETMGKECIHLQQVIMQRCDWVTAQVIWLWVTHCPKLIRLDARRSNKCSVKKLIANLLEAEPNQYQQQLQREDTDQHSQDNPHQQQEDMGMELMMMNDPPMLDHSEEEEDERIFFGNLRHQQLPQQQQRPYLHDRHHHHHPIQNQNNYNNNNSNNNTNRIPPAVTHGHELLNTQRFRDNLEALETTLTQRLQQRRGGVNRRPGLNRRSTTTTTSRTSITNNTSSDDNNSIPEWRTLKQVVYDILVDAVERGADLPWFP